MPLETALAYIRGAGGEQRKRIPPVAVIFGPHAFLREYVLDSIVRTLVADGCQYRSFQIGAGDDYGAALNELSAPDLFAPRRAIACRILKSRRDKAETATDADAGDTRASGSGGSEAALVAAIESAQGPGHLVLLYEKDNAPAKVRRVAEKPALLVNCMRPFDNQIEQYVSAFAQALGLKLLPAALDLIISRHGGDLAAIANTLGKVTIFAEPGKPVQPGDLDEGARRMPEAFELAESVARGRPSAALAQLGRALALGREVFEILAVEIIPMMRRMMIAASMMAARRSQG
ncbi:DNA polymerase III subunit delta, partial [Candidatus Binatus sp.]|uniref:DNA polymerase III subunit delta n=1 Tax=Candidatus Binatus sp. TaxID=2811406 RepID=UPI003CC6220A